MLDVSLAPPPQKKISPKAPPDRAGCLAASWTLCQKTYGMTSWQTSMEDSSPLQNPVNEPGEVGSWTKSHYLQRVYDDKLDFQDLISKKNGRLPHPTGWNLACLLHDKKKQTEPKKNWLVVSTQPKFYRFPWPFWQRSENILAKRMILL